MSGGIIAYSTESYYALGVIALNEKAVNRLFAIKKRPSGKPVPVIVGEREVLGTMVSCIPAQAEHFMQRFWPGPLTIIFEANKEVPPLVTGYTGKVAVRVPGTGTALDLAQSLKIPVTATSSNLSGEPPAENPDDVIRYFGSKIDLIIDTGTSPGGLPSTIIDITVTPPEILREGRVTPVELKNLL